MTAVGEHGAVPWARSAPFGLSLLVGCRPGLRMGVGAGLCALRACVQVCACVRGCAWVCVCPLALRPSGSAALWIGGPLARRSLARRSLRFLARRPSSSAPSGSAALRLGALASGPVARAPFGSLVSGLLCVVRFGSAARGGGGGGDGIGVCLCTSMPTSPPVSEKQGGWVGGCCIEGRDRSQGGDGAEKHRASCHRQRVVSPGPEECRQHVV